MKKVSKIFISFLFTVSLLVGVGCALTDKEEPPKAPKEMMQDAMSTMQAATSYAYDIQFDADIKGPQGETPQNIKFAGTMGGVVNSEDKANPNFSLKANGSATLDAEANRDFSFELAFVEKVIYANLAKLPLLESDGVPEELTTTFVGKWWSYPLPAEIAAQFNELVGTQETEEQKKINEVVKNSNFFSPEYVGAEKVGSVNSFKYKINFDKTEFINLVDQIGKIKNQPLSSGDKEDLEKTLAAITVSGFVYIADVEMPYVSKIDATIAIDENESEVKGTIKLSWTNSGLNSTPKVTAPKDAQPFNPMLLAPLLGGGNAFAPGEEAPATSESVLSIE